MKRREFILLISSMAAPRPLATRVQDPVDCDDPCTPGSCCQPRITASAGATNLRWTEGRCDHQRRHSPNSVLSECCDQDVPIWEGAHGLMWGEACQQSRLALDPILLVTDRHKQKNSSRQQGRVLWE